MMTNRQQTCFLDVCNKEHDEQDNAHAGAKENRNKSVEIDLDCGFTQMMLSKSEKVNYSQIALVEG